MLPPDEIAGLPIDEYGFPGPLRDSLVGAILDGRKRSTTSLVAQYLLDNEALPVVGDRGVVVDSSEKPVCVTEVTEVRVVPLAAVDEAHAIDEGEGYETVSDWRSGHEEFWHGPEFRAAMRDPNFTVSDATKVVLVRFRVPIQVGKFDAINGLKVVSRDGAAHTVMIKVEGASGSTNNDLSFSSATTIDPKIEVLLQTPGKVTVNGTSSLDTSIQEGAFATSGAVNLG